MDNLIKRFISSKTVVPKHVNELLDFSQTLYIQGVISASEYRTLIQKLEQCGAKKPEYGLSNNATVKLKDKFPALL